MPVTRQPQAEPAAVTTAQDSAPPEVVDDGGIPLPVRLDGRSGSATELGRLLVVAWVSQDPAELQAYINDGDGRELAPAKRSLVQAFMTISTFSRKSG